MTIQNFITRYMRQGQLSLEYRFYAGGHEILNEAEKDDAEKDDVHRDVAHWLTQILDRQPG